MPWVHASRDVAPSARALLDAFVPPDREQRATRDLMRAALAEDAEPFARTSPRHFTASALAVHAQRGVLLVWHARLARWVQPGGHCDGDPDLVACAWRELEEETGLASVGLLVPPLDLERFEVPAAAGAPAHAHLDVAFLARVPPWTPPREEARWFRQQDLAALETDASVRRRAARAFAALPPAERSEGP